MRTSGHGVLSDSVLLSVADRRARADLVLRRAGLRPTRRRIAVLATLVGSAEHRTPGEVHADVDGVPALTLDSVRTILEQLTEHGVLHAHQGSPSSFRMTLSPHHHLSCTRCQQMTDLPGSDLSDVVAMATRSGVFSIAADGSITLHALCVRCGADGGDYRRRPRSPQPAR